MIRITNKDTIDVIFTDGERTTHIGISLNISIKYTIYLTHKYKN